MEEHEEIVDSSDLKIQEIRGFVGKIFGMVEDKKPRRDETLLARGGGQHRIILNTIPRAL